MVGYLVKKARCIPERKRVVHGIAFVKLEYSSSHIRYFKYHS